MLRETMMTSTLIPGARQKMTPFTAYALPTERRRAAVARKAVVLACGATVVFSRMGKKVLCPLCVDEIFKKS